MNSSLESKRIARCTRFLRRHESVGLYQELASWARDNFDIPIVCGGIHALVSPDEILRTDLLIMFFAEKCEEAFADFVEKLSRENLSTMFPTFASCATAGLNQSCRPASGFGAAAFKDYSIMDFQKLIDAKKGWVGLMASRGCPFSCTYCFNHKMLPNTKETSSVLSGSSTISADSGLTRLSMR